MLPTPFEVTWLYRALLGRDPESKAVLKEACMEPSIHALRRRILRSEEFRMRLSGASTETGIWAFESERNLIADLAWHSPLSEREIQLAFIAVLKRNPNASEIRDHLKRRSNLLQLIGALLDSNERKEFQERRTLFAQFTRRLEDQRTKRLPRILFFGAYNNGNIGDACQFDAIASLLVQYGISLNNVELFACSWEDKIPAKTKTVSLVPKDEIINAECLRSYDFIVIGGGGLFSTPHFPLFEQDWSRGLATLDVPYGVFGVGASTEEISHQDRRGGYRALLTNAAFVIARDTSSLEAFKTVRGDARLAQDPFLIANAGTFIDNWKENRVGAPGQRVVFIPKIPSDHKEAKAIEQLVSLQAHLDGAGITNSTVLFEPIMDVEIADKFRNVIYVDNADQALALIADASVVYSMRYHGAIMSLVSGVSCWTFGAPKLLELYTEIGIERFFSTGGEQPAELTSVFQADDWSKLYRYLSDPQRSDSPLEDAVQSIKNILDQRKELKRSRKEVKRSPAEQEKHV